MIRVDLDIDGFRAVSSEVALSGAVGTGIDDQVAHRVGGVKPG